MIKFAGRVADYKVMGTRVGSGKMEDSYWSGEVALMGGLSVFASLALWLTMEKGASLYMVSQVAFFVAFAANHPHFLSSYLLLYGDFRSHILKRPRYFWAGVVVPFVLGGCLVYAMLTSSQPLMAHVITSMFFFVGWHYVKQVFGCIVVTSAQRKRYYSAVERRVMLINLFSTWFVSWLSNQIKVGDGGNAYAAFSFYGIPHYRLNLDPMFLTAAYAVMALSFVGVAYIHIARYVRLGVKPSPPGVAAFVALYAWYIPAIIHPAFAYFIPLFHSLQYLAFVGTLKRNQVAHEAHHLEEGKGRRVWFVKFGGFVFLSVVLGALAFEFVPKGLDGQSLVSGLGPSPILASFLLFINIHHYFIDNVIWRSDNEVVKRFLFQSAEGRGASVKVRNAA